MSNRKQAHRRRAYGRRQHEVHERRERGEAWSVDWMGGSDGGPAADRSREPGHTELGGTGTGTTGGGFSAGHPELRWEQGA